MQGLPVTVLNANTKRDQGKKAQLGNIMAAKVSSGARGPGRFAIRRQSCTGAICVPPARRRRSRISSGRRWGRDLC